MEIPRCDEWHTSTPLGIPLRTIKNAQIILSRGRENNVLTESHGGLSRSFFGVNETLNEVRLQARSDREKWCRAASCGLRTRSRGKFISRLSGSIRKDSHLCTRPFPRTNQGNQYLVNRYGQFYKWLEAHAIPS
jgi:hypothetical protein